MYKIPQEIIDFFETQGFAIVSTLDKNGFPHSSCKGVVRVSKQGIVYLMDVYQKDTFNNLKHDPRISITAIDEHKFKGYCLKGKAKVLMGKKITPLIQKAWDDKLTSRITRRLLRNIHEEKGHPRHPEIQLPRPEYLIAVGINEIVDLTPHHLK